MSAESLDTSAGLELATILSAIGKTDIAQLEATVRVLSAIIDLEVQLDISPAVDPQTEAFNEIYAQHFAFVHGIALGIVRDTGIADDITQEVFANAWRARNSYTESGLRKAWLARIARNVSIDWKHKAMRTREFPSDFEEGSLIQRNPPFAKLGISAEDETLNGDHSRLIETLRRLRPEEAAVLTALYIEGYSMTEYAQETGIALGTVQSRSYRGRRRLLALMDITQQEAKTDSRSRKKLTEMITGDFTNS